MEFMCRRDEEESRLVYQPDLREPRDTAHSASPPQAVGD
jgi:hypothetical protein